MKASRKQKSEPCQGNGFISKQVTQSRRYYFDLNPGDRRGAVVICGGCERMRADYFIDRQDFPFFAIECVAEGRGTLQLAGESYNLTPGMVFAYGPSIPHLIRSDPEKPMLKYYIDFVGKGAERLLANSILSKCNVLQLSSPQEIVDIYELLQREGELEGRFGAEICSSLLKVLIRVIDRNAMPYGSGEFRAFETFLRVKRVMQDRLMTMQSVEEVASTCHIDPSYLSRLFQRFAATPPHRFVTKLKMARATELLLDQRMLVREAADALGFTNAFHFSRTFKRIYGISPLMFLKQNRIDVTTHPISERE